MAHIYWASHRGEAQPGGSLVVLHSYLHQEDVCSWLPARTVFWRRGVAAEMPALMGRG